MGLKTKQEEAMIQNEQETFGMGAAIYLHTLQRRESDREAYTKQVAEIC